MYLPCHKLYLHISSKFDATVVMCCILPHSTTEQRKSCKKANIKAANFRQNTKKRAHSTIFLNEKTHITTQKYVEIKIIIYWLYESLSMLSCSFFSCVVVAHCSRVQTTPSDLIPKKIMPKKQVAPQMCPTDLLNKFWNRVGKRLPLLL